jgi:hypothetical protein
MRTNLTVPFAEKDAAKSLGARWDPALRVWYISNVPDLAPFARWIHANEGTNASTRAAATPVSSTRPATVTRSPRNGPLCDCAVLPWEPCPHTPAT